MPLSDTAILNAKLKPYELAGEKRLYLPPSSDGKWWQLNSRFKEKRKILYAGASAKHVLKEVLARRDKPGSV